MPQLDPKDGEQNQYWQAIFIGNSVQPVGAVYLDGQALTLNQWVMPHV